MLLSQVLNIVFVDKADVLQASALPAATAAELGAERHNLFTDILASMAESNLVVQRTDFSHVRQCLATTNSD